MIDGREDFDVNRRTFDAPHNPASLCGLCGRLVVDVWSVWEILVVDVRSVWMRLVVDVRSV